MRKLFRTFLDVMTPGAPNFKEKLAACEKREEILRKHLQMLEQPASNELKHASDEAAEFCSHVPNSTDR